MATRIYIPSDNTTYPPKLSVSTPDASWDDDLANAGVFQVQGHTDKKGTALTYLSDSPGSAYAANTEICCLQVVVGPIAAVTISGTLRFIFEWDVDDTSFSTLRYQTIGAWIYTPAGTERHELEAAGAFLDDVAFSTAPNSRHHAVTMTSGDAERGDYLVIEVGFEEKSANSMTTKLRIGDAPATDFTSGFNGEQDLCPWIDLDDVTLEILSGVPNQLMMTGAGT